MVSSVGIDHEFIGITPGETTVDFTDWTRNREPGSSVTLVIFDISGNSVTVSAKMAGTSSSQDDGLEDDASEDDASEDGASGDEPAAGTCAIASAGAMPWPSVLVSMLVLLAGLGARRR